jgi:hypothetical protein
LSLQQRLSKKGVLPVVSRFDVRRIQAVITPQTVVQFLQTAWDDRTTSIGEESVSSPRL